LPGRYGNTIYAEAQNAITLSNDVFLRSSDSFLYMPLFDSSASLGEIRIVNADIKDGAYANGMLFVDGGANSHALTDMLVQGGSCGSSSLVSPTPTCIRVNTGNVKVTGVDLSNVVAPFAPSCPGTIIQEFNLGYTAPVPSPSPCP
jgi:hypothetical protein